MKRLIVAAVVAFATVASAQEVTIKAEAYGSGTPGSNGFENATQVENDIFHAPGYLPAFPTAGTIWPRVVDVPCVRSASGLKCAGFEWTPKMGRGEYLFFRPRIVEPETPPIVIERERVIIKEVPPKKVHE